MKEAIDKMKWHNAAYQLFEKYYVNLAISGNGDKTGFNIIGFLY